MALIKCSECGKEVSSQAKVCPNCGKKINGSGQNTIILIILLIVQVALFVNGFFKVNLSEIIVSSILSIITLAISAKSLKNNKSISIIAIILSIVVICGQCYLYYMVIRSYNRSASSNNTKQTISQNVNLYEYIEKCINKNSNTYYKYTINNIGDNFNIKYERTGSIDKTYGVINFTEKSVKEYSSSGSVQFVDIMNFDTDYNITNIHRTSTVMGIVTNEDVSPSSDTFKSTSKVFKDSIINDIYEILNNSQKTIVLCEKTVTQLKNETVNI